MRRAALAALLLLPLLRVATTHRVFSATADEPAHIAAGYDWLTSGTYVLDPNHPPLARVLFGIALRANGVVSKAPENWTILQPFWHAVTRGTDLLWQNGRYLSNLTRARQANLLFLLAALIAVTAWAWRSFGWTVALIALALFGSLPPILGHAGVATTDMAAAATLALALFALKCWLARPTLVRALLLGLAIGAGLASKMSFIPFFGVGSLVLLVIPSVARKLGGRGGTVGAPLPPRSLATLGMTVSVALVVLWGSYRFDFGPMQRYAPSATFATDVPLPAPAYFTGITFLKVHSERGHPAFLMGRRGDMGWWYYFVIALLVKTPVAFLILFAVGVTRAFKSETIDAIEHVLIAGVILLSVMPSTINVGIRHILGIYPSMAIVAAYGVVELWRSRKWIAVVLLAWHTIATSLAHPDYLASFNELAGRHPERVLVDSNLDWGQDILRLAKVAKEEKIDRLSLFVFGSNDLDRIGLPPHQKLDPYVPTQGWIAISETALQFEGAEKFDWLTKRRPVRRVGKSIRLYYVE